MNLAEVRRTHREPAARNLWQAGGDRLTPGALDRIIADKESAAVWVSRRVRIVSWLLFAAALCFVLLGFWLDFGLDVLQRSLIAFFALAGCWITVIASHPIEADADLALARTLRAAFEREARDLARLRARLRRGESVALFLRTFSAETEAMTKTDVTSAAMDLRNSVLLDESDPATRRAAWAQLRTAERMIAKLKDDWTLRHQVLTAIAAILPVICLGNVELQAEKQSQLRALGVEDVTLVSTDWWPVFVEVEAAAAVTVMLLDTFTQHISRELEHLAGRDRPFVLAATRAVDARLAADDRYCHLLARPNVTHVVVGEDDIGELQRAVSTLIRTGMN